MTDFAINSIRHGTVLSPKQSAIESALPLWKHLLAFFVSHHVTEGLAKIYGFEVLRHGTSIPKYINILRNGVDPLMGGAGIGNLNPVKNDGDAQKTRGCWRTFHMYKDSDNISESRGALSSSLIKRFGPHMHAMLTSVGEVMSISKSIPLAPLRYLIGAITGIFWGIINLVLSPTLRFVYRRDEVESISENDPYYWNLAIRTYNGLTADDFQGLKERYSKDNENILEYFHGATEEHANAAKRSQKAIEDNSKGPIFLPNHRIGLMGLLQHAKKIDRENAWENDKLAVVAGSVQLVAGVVLTMAGIGWVL